VSDGSLIGRANLVTTRGQVAAECMTAALVAVVANRLMTNSGLCASGMLTAKSIIDY